MADEPLVALSFLLLGYVAAFVLARIEQTRGGGTRFELMKPKINQQDKCRYIVDLCRLLYLKCMDKAAQCNDDTLCSLERRLCFMSDSGLARQICFVMQQSTIVERPRFESEKGTKELVRP